MNVLNETKEGMEKAVKHLQETYRKLRTNRVNPQMLDDVSVEAYGATVVLKSLATITVQERSLIVTPFDPQNMQAIAKGIGQSSLNVNPIVEQGMIRVPVPPLDEQMRKEIAKQAKQKSEEAKISVREARRKGNDTLKKQKSAGEITEDDVKRTEKKIQEHTDHFVAEIDKVYKSKEQDILSV